MIGELRGQLAVRLVVLRHHHQAGRVLVEPVHDAGPLDPTDPRKARAAMGDQRIHQRAGAVSGRRVHHQPLRLVDHDQRVILENDVQRDVFRSRRGRLVRRHRERDPVARIDAVARIADCGFADCRSASQDQSLQARAGEGGEALGQYAVEPLAPLGGGDVHNVMAGPVGHEYE